MTKTKKATKRRKGQSASKAMLDVKPDETIALYDAVAAFVKAKGGNVLVIGGIQMLKWPDDRQHNFMIAVRITGIEPTVGFTSNDMDETRRP